MPDLFLLPLTPLRLGESGKVNDEPAAFLMPWLLRRGCGNSDEVTNQSSLTMQTGLPLSPVETQAQLAVSLSGVKFFRCVRQSNECPEEIKPVKSLLRPKGT